jgi:hypothetical protein
MAWEQAGKIMYVPRKLQLFLFLLNYLGRKCRTWVQCFKNAWVCIFKSGYETLHKAAFYVH